MKVTEALAKNTPTLSFEFFPPRTKEQEDHLFAVIARLKKFDPDFVSVTYGAMGTTREKTFYWVSEIKKRFQVEPVAHLTCVAATADDIAQQLDELEKAGAQNILALRGDPPEGQENFVPPRNGFRYAKELIAFIKKHKPGFCLGAAGFPEKKDTQHLKEKIAAGADYVITQLFFDDCYYFDFVARCRKAGIEAPIIPGLMPITSFKQILKITKMCGATIPKDLLEKIEKHKDDPQAIQLIGAEHALKQSVELLDSSVKGIHFFVMNQAEPISQILSQLKI